MSLNGQRVKEQGYTPQVWTRRAVDFISEPQSSPRPWFLVVSYPNPHTPYEGHPQRYYDLYKNTNFESIGIERKAPNVLREARLMDDPVGNLRKAAAATTALDDQIPPLLKALDATGQRPNTLVVFAGDNGFLYGRHGAWSKGYATNPINMYEEVIRVPLILSYPSQLKGGRVLQNFVSFYDMLPTVCEAAGVERRRLEQLVRERNLPGKSYWLALLGQSQRWENIGYFHFRNTDAIRDTRFKLVVRNEGQGPNELFNLSEDPREKQNRIEDAALAKTRKSLEEKLLQRIARYR